MTFLRFITTSGLMLLSLPAAADEFGNSDIIALAEAGVADQIILSRMERFSCVYDVSTSAIIALRRAGVSNEIISAILQRCDQNEQVLADQQEPLPLDVPTEPGIYFRSQAKNSHNWVALDSSLNGTFQWRGNGSLLFPFKLQLNLPANQPRHIFPQGNIEFYLRLNIEPDSPRDVFTANPAPLGVQQFGLAKLTTEDGFRHVLMDSKNNNSTLITIDEDYLVNCSVGFIENGLYRVANIERLDRGFYGFVVKMNNGGEYKVFEFEVR